MWKLELTTDEALLLDGRVSPEAQAVVNKARFASTLSGLTEAQAKVVSNAHSIAVDTGILLWASRSIDFCPICKKTGDYPVYKSGPRRGRPKDGARRRCFRGIETKDSFIRVQGHISCGGCAECMEALRPTLTAALADVQAQVPDAISAEGRTSWKRFDDVECNHCGWEGHEGLVGPVRTMFGDGFYPGICPGCFSERPIMGADLFKRKGTHSVVDASTLPKWERTSATGFKHHPVPTPTARGES